MAHIIEKKMHFLLRVKSSDSFGILRKLNLPQNTDFDQSFHIELTKKQTNQVKAAPDLYRFISKKSRFDFCDLHHTIFYPMDFRVVAVEIEHGCWEYLITNLDNTSFPPQMLKELYHLCAWITPRDRLQFPFGHPPILCAWPIYHPIACLRFLKALMNLPHTDALMLTAYFLPSDRTAVRFHGLYFTRCQR